jgi:hypothetical protein
VPDTGTFVTLVVVVTSALLALPPAAAVGPPAASAPASSTASSSSTHDACAHALDAVAPTATSAGCAGPASVASSVVADDKAPPAAPARAPSTLPGELGFVALALGVAGGSAMIGAQATDVQRLDDEHQLQQRALFLSGASLVGLAGLVGAGAVAVTVFDPSTGTLRLPLFSGED